MIKFGNNDTKLYLGANEVTSIYLGSTQVYSGDTPTPPTPTPYDEQYLTIESTSNNNTIYWLNPRGDGMNKTISASIDNGTTWTEYESSDDPGTAIATLNTNDKLLLKGMEGTYEARGTITSTSSFIVYGNIMSLLYDDNFVGQTTLLEDDTFKELFWSNPLTSAENLVLPATTLAYGCYRNMFFNCSSLTTAPELPATTLTDSCYYGMFGGCTILETAPVLSATTLAEACYANMFGDCTSLNYIKCLATDISASDCTFQWVNGVPYNGTFIKAASMSDWTTGSDGIPDGWAVQNDDGSPVGGGDWEQ